MLLNINLAGALVVGLVLGAAVTLLHIGAHSEDLTEAEERDAGGLGQEGPPHTHKSH